MIIEQTRNSQGTFTVQEEKVRWDELKAFLKRVDEFQKESEKVNFIVGEHINKDIVVTV